VQLCEVQHDFLILGKHNSNATTPIDTDSAGDTATGAHTDTNTHTNTHTNAHTTSTHTAGSSSAQQQQQTTDSTGTTHSSSTDGITPSVSVDHSTDANSTSAAQQQQQHQPHALLTGMAYLSGSDTWFDVPKLLGVHATQPDRVHPRQHSHELYPKVAPLLSAMTTEFSRYVYMLRCISTIKLV
jgi:hypothetical protein